MATGKKFDVLCGELRTLFRNDSMVGLGCSGGLDSMVLAEALWKSEIPFRVLHFNHGWRGNESDQDQQLIFDWCRERNVPFNYRKWQKPRKTEEAARNARLTFFQSCVRRYGLDGILLAHHRDDLAETFLMNLFRGAGTGGLASMRPQSQFREMTLYRPLLSTSRQELEQIARARQIRWREDSSNRDLNFTRNRVRLKLMPELKSLFGREPAPLLARTARILIDENDYWEKAFPEQPERLSVRDLRQLHPAAQRRRIFSWVTAQTGASPDFNEVESIRGLIICNQPAKINLKKGRHCRRKQGKLFIEA